MFETNFKRNSQSGASLSFAQAYFAADTVIGGAFRIVSKIGEGGMGVVYLARHLGLNRTFALKILSPNLVNEQSWLRFQAEAKTLSSLNHSSLVKVYDLGVHEKTVPFYSMDYLVGSNLEEILCKHGHLTLQQTLSVFLTMLDGLAYAHRNGIVHRDIKPANIFICASRGSVSNVAHKLIDNDTEVKILDFGISKLIDANGTGQHLTSDGEIFGSPFYMSPEQCRGEAVDARSDIYAVGCTLFEALTGFVPFEGTTGLETSLMHEEKEPPFLSDVLPDHSYPAALDQVLAKCLAKLPRNRYQTAKELALDLNRIREGRNIQIFVEQAQPSTELQGERGYQRPAVFLVPFALVAIALFAVVAIGGGLLVTNKTAIEKPAGKPKAQVVLPVAQPKIALNGNFVVSNLEELWVISPADKRAIEAFLKSRKEPYSMNVMISGKPQRKFSFPADFSIGTVKYWSDKKEQKLEATGTLSAPANKELYFTGNVIAATYPALLKFFRPDDLYELSMTQPVEAGYGDHIASVLHLKGLRELQLSGRSFDEEALGRLDKMTNLSNLRLRYGATNGAALARMKWLEQLYGLQVESVTDVTALLNRLVHSRKIRTLSIEKTKFAKQDFANIASMKGLTGLSLRGSNITNADLEELTTLQGLSELDISQCSQLDKHCIETIKKFKKLIKLTAPYQLEQQDGAAPAADYENSSLSRNLTKVLPGVEIMLR